MLWTAQRSPNRRGFRFHAAGEFTLELMAEPPSKNLLPETDEPLGTEDEGTQDDGGVDEEPDEVWS